jgi:hypothetical protein
VSTKSKSPDRTNQFDCTRIFSMRRIMALLDEICNPKPIYRPRVHLPNSNNNICTWAHQAGSMSKMYTYMDGGAPARSSYERNKIESVAIQASDLRLWVVSRNTRTGMLAARTRLGASWRGSNDDVERESVDSSRKTLALSAAGASAASRPSRWTAASLGAPLNPDAVSP